MTRRLSLLLALATLPLPAVTGCGSHNRGGIAPANPASIKPPPHPTQVPIDPQLQAAAKQELADALRSTEPEIRAHALEGMRQVMGADAAPQILQALHDPDPRVRFAGAMAAGELKLPDATKPLEVMLQDPDDVVRVAVRFALHRLGDTSHSHDLEKLSLDPRPGVRGATAMVFGRLGEPSAVRILLHMRSEPSAAVRQQASEALWLLGDEKGKGLEDLVGLAASNHPDDQMFALLALAGRRDGRVRESIRAGLSADWIEVKLVAARAGHDQ